MMSSASPSSMDLTAILETLESKKTSGDEKTGAYTVLSSHLKEEELSFTSLDIPKQAERILSVLKRDIQSSSPGVQQGALEILGYCLHDSETVQFISAQNATAILTQLIKCVDDTEDKVTATRGLWCLGKQRCAEAVISEELPALVELCDKAFVKWRGVSTAVEHEALNAVVRFVEQVPVAMESCCSKWAKNVVLLVAHPAIKIREKILPLLETMVPWVLSHKEIGHSLVPEFKTKLCGDLKKLFVKNEIQILKIWQQLVTLFGEELHIGSFINTILPIAELGFKHASAEIKIEAFRAWKCLISNFALNSNIIGDQKRIKLIMQVFKINNAKVESVAKEKLLVWWHFVQALGQKLTHNFDQVVVPLLQFCVGGLGAGATPGTPGTSHLGLKSLASPGTPRLNLAVNSPGINRPVFPVIQQQGMEVLAQILACPSKVTENTPVTASIGKLNFEVISGTSMFLKHANVVVSCTLDLICAQGANIAEPLLLYVWQCLLHHLHTALESSSKSENREALSCFLGHFQTLVFSQALSSKLVMKFFPPVCSLPQRVLSSTAYSVNTGEVVKGTPVLFLCEIFLAPTLLKDQTSSETYFTLFSSLVTCGASTLTGVLEFCQAVLDILSRNASFISNPESLWRLWSIVANTLQEHIGKTNEVNQGDSLEYNFDCMHTALLLPVKHKLGSKLSQTVVKVLLKTWSDMYRTFARLSALVTTAEANIACEEFCHKVLHSLQEDDTKDSAVVDFTAQICQTVLESMDFSSLGQSNSFSHGVSLSPSKWAKRKQKPMENLHSFIKLLVHLLEDLEKICETGDTTHSSRQKAASVTSCATQLVDVLCSLFTHITVSTIIGKMLGFLATPISWFYSSSAKKTCGKLFSVAFMQKLERLWLDISTCIQSRYTMPYDTEFLACVAPLLRETLLHPRRQIKNQSLILWKATFSHAATLLYPEDLKPVLAKVKEKTPLVLPGWLQSDTTEIEETPFSQFSQMDTAPDACLPGLPSPHKIIGSFMHKAVSPNIKKSPAKPQDPEPLKVNSAKKKLDINAFKNEDFVVIKSSPKKKRVLTEHQKEVLKERRTLPVMYNNLDLSQDVSLMSQFNSDTQQESILVPSQSPDSVIVIDSSQSQNLLEKPKDDSQSLRKSLSSEFQPNITEERKPQRRRSLRLTSDENSDSEKRDLRSKVKGSDKGEKSVQKGSQEKKESDEDHKFKDPDINSNMKSLESSGELKSPSLKQNLMQAIGDQWLNTLSSKETSGSSKSDSSGENGQASAGGSQNSSSSSSQSSQDTIKRRSPFKSLSQSPPERKSRSPGRKSQSLEYSSSSKSPKSKDRNKLGQSSNLDKWLLKSPLKEAKPEPIKSPDSSFVPCTQSPKELEQSLLHSVIEDTQSPKKTEKARAHSFVEDTQSPSKFSQNKLLSPDVNASIEETPEKKSLSVSGPLVLSPSRNLFADETEPSGKTSSLDRKKHSEKETLLVVVDKLTPADVVELSHEQPLSKALFSEPEEQMDVGECSGTNTDIPCSQGFPTMSGERAPQQGPVQSEDSQISVDSSQGFTGILSFVQRSELNNLSSSSSSNVSVSVSREDAKSSERLESKEENTAAQDEPMTEDLFQTCPTSEYNPDGIATLGERSSQSSSGSSQSKSQEKASDLSSQESSGSVAPTPEGSYNPNLDSTLADDSGGNRKRKQDTPKKIGIEELRRTPRQRKKKNFEGFEVDGTETSQIRKSARKSKSLEEEKNSDLESQKSEEGSSKEEDGSKKLGRRRKLIKDEAEEESQESSKAAGKFRGQKRKLEEEDDEEDIPLSQISEQKKQAKSESSNEPEQNLEKSEDGPSKRKRTRKSLASENEDVPLSQIRKSTRLDQAGDEMKSSGEEAIKAARRVQTVKVSVQNHAAEDSDSSQSEVKSRRRVTLQKVDKACDDEQTVDASSEEKKSDTPLDVQDEKDSKVAKVVQDIKSTLDKELSDKVSTQKSRPEDNSQDSEVILVDMEEGNTELQEVDSQMSKDVLKGEHTPSSRPLHTPVRRSTTKQKMEAARKRSLSKNSGPKEDDSSVEDGNEWTASLKSAKAELLKQEDKSSEDKNAISSEADIIEPSQSEGTSLHVSFCSPQADDEKIKGKVDEIISSLASPVLSQKFAAKRKRSIVKPKVASPLSVRLRSSRLVLRARSKFGIKCVSKVSPLALGRTRRRASQSPNMPVDMPGKGSDQKNVKLLESSCDKFSDVSKGSEENAKSEKQPEADKPETPAGEAAERLMEVEKQGDALEGTPRRSAEKPVRRQVNPSRAFSDSKVLSMNRIRARNRISDRGMNIVRRSILKHKTTLTAASPVKRSHDSDFHPIRVFQFNSPSASPSAGILKKRRLCGAIAVNSPSPPSKRRVSFAEPVISGASPHRGERTAATTKQQPGKAPDALLVDSQPSQSQCSFQSTQESQLNCTDPVYPDLIGCTESVVKVLPQLTSSVWSRGLGQLVKARNINTVGDLSKLTEMDIHNLPIRSPKVVTVRRVLHDLEQHLELKRPREVKVVDVLTKSDSSVFKVPDVKTSLDTITEDKENREEHDEPDSLPNMEDALDELEPNKDGVDLNSSIEAEPEEPKVMETGGETDRQQKLTDSCDLLISQSLCTSSNISQSEAINSRVGQSESVNSSISQSDAVSSNISQSESVSTSISQSDTVSSNVSQSKLVGSGIGQSKDVSQPEAVNSSISQSDTDNLSFNQSKPANDSDSQGSVSMETTEECEPNRGEKLAKSVEDLMGCVDYRLLNSMRTGDLFQVHQRLSQLSNMVITAMKSRCHSPPNSK